MIPSDPDDEPATWQDALRYAAQDLGPIAVPIGLALVWGLLMLWILT